MPVNQEGGENNEGEELEELALPVLESASPERMHELRAEHREGLVTVLD